MFKAAGPGDLIFFLEESGGKLLNALNDVRVLNEPGWRNESAPCTPQPAPCHNTQARACKELPSSLCDLQRVIEAQARIQGCQFS